MYPNNQWPGQQPSEANNNSQQPNGSYPPSQQNIQSSYPPPHSQSGYSTPQGHPQAPYPPHSGSNQAPPPTLPPVTNMTSYLPPPPPQHPDMHMYSMPPGAYGRPPPHQQMPPQGIYAAQPAPAPRQRTAIACRYCRRRKIRCSGFENSEDGRCQNCTRFSQECIFTPVSAQTQAFVPAHTIYRGGQAPPTQLYGAYGQPLPNTAVPTDYRAQQAYPLTNPASYPPQHQHGYMTAPASHEMPNGVYSRKRPSDEPHTPSLPPPNPGTTRGDRYNYPDPTALAPAGAVSPASSSASYHSVPHQGNAAQPYYVNPPSAAAHAQPAMQNIAERPRVSPTNSSHNYDTSRASSSPHNQPYSGTPHSGEAGNLRPPSTQPNRSNGRTPPPRTSQDGGPGGRPQMSISSIVSGQQNSQNSNEGASPGTRSTADSDMIKKLR